MERNSNSGPLRDSTPARPTTEQRRSEMLLQRVAFPLIEQLHPKASIRDRYLMQSVIAEWTRDYFTYLKLGATSETPEPEEQRPGEPAKSMLYGAMKDILAPEGIDFTGVEREKWNSNIWDVVNIMRVFLDNETLSLPDSVKVMELNSFMKQEKPNLERTLIFVRDGHLKNKDAKIIYPADIIYFQGIESDTPKKQKSIKITGETVILNSPISNLWDGLDIEMSAENVFQVKSPDRKFWIGKNVKINAIDKFVQYESTMMNGNVFCSEYSFMDDQSIGAYGKVVTRQVTGPKKYLQHLRWSNKVIIYPS